MEAGNGPEGAEHPDAFGAWMSTDSVRSVLDRLAARTRVSWVPWSDRHALAQEAAWEVWRWADRQQSEGRKVKAPLERLIPLFFRRREGDLLRKRASQEQREVRLSEHAESMATEDGHEEAVTQASWVRSVVATLSPLDQEVARLLMDQHRPADIQGRLNLTPPRYYRSLGRIRASLQSARSP